MLKFVTRLLVSASICLAALAPASAMPVMPLKPVQVQAQGTSGDVVDVYYKRRGGFYRYNNRYYFNGHRGFRYQRYGYRHYNGYWFPPAAFALGVIIGNSIGGGYGVRPGYTHPQHVRYCYNRYRSYRQYDNTFQPYHGPRRQCRSSYY